ncbi:hypothetical protein SCATT_p02990 (plasmid) [Streptantibioticus cattleyicolor NRRL 8057 = DSM 46488]|uniref:Uncharacterized protein n=1 Tax=Streptantibioticus cattleyicolor (strain ATCC 35852 / DSM 46488 / JCM 4925 / NBRC 14057 / NRRL 8057) TaxID=1003195 RepID=F8JKE4_STREN|nr:hypothetical protein SCATT_p02990 [Streptantibioticus cattleyicolor NRRL 8057 = DSM 46488]CCB72451.1 protein of unknown function [Streptantibioticus cattleyicolor NRRL 8057 = DSM 46488]
MGDTFPRRAVGGKRQASFTPQVLRTAMFLDLAIVSSREKRFA